MRHPDHSPNGYDFEVHGGEVVHEGKSHWPDCLGIVLSRRMAHNLLAQLANGLQYPDQEEFHISWCGILVHNEKGNWPFGPHITMQIKGELESGAVIEESEPTN